MEAIIIVVGLDLGIVLGVVQCEQTIRAEMFFCPHWGWAAHSFLGKVFGSFMISRLNLGCSHWLEFVYTRMLS